METRKTTPTEKKVCTYLNDLRESCATNMFGARPYIIKKFKLDSEEAKRILMIWMHNYNAEGNYDTVKYENVSVKK